MPKSSTLAWPRRVTKMLAGLTSRWTMPRACAASRRVGDLDAELEHAVERQRAARELVLQRPAVEQFHDDELLAVVLADVVDRADVRVVERRGDARLAAEAVERFGVGGEIGGQELQRDLAAEADVLGAVDHAHAAGAEPLENLVMGDNGANHRVEFYIKVCA